MGCNYNMGKVGTTKKVVLVGLDGAGKTTLLYHLNSAGVAAIVPGIGFNVERLVHKGIEFISFDVGGCDKIKVLRDHLMEGVSQLVFIIDSHDHDRGPEACKELEWFQTHRMFTNVPILILANKKDLPNTYSLEEIVEFGCSW